MQIESVQKKKNIQALEARSILVRIFLLMNIKGTEIVK